MKRSRVASLGLSLLTVCAGGAATALGAYATSHQSEQPALYVALALAANEAVKYLDKRNHTRSL